MSVHGRISGRCWNLTRYLLNTRTLSEGSGVTWWSKPAKYSAHACSWVFPAGVGGQHMIPSHTWGQSGPTPEVRGQGTVSAFSTRGSESEKLYRFSNHNSRGHLIYNMVHHHCPLYSFIATKYDAGKILMNSTFDATNPFFRDSPFSSNGVQFESGLWWTIRRTTLEFCQLHLS